MMHLARLIALAALLSVALGANAQQPPRQQPGAPAAKSQRREEPRQPARPGTASGAGPLIPGVGGIPPRSASQAETPPHLPGQVPAAVGLPGMPGTASAGAGLLARQTNPLLFGVNVYWTNSGSLQGWDRGGLANARRLAKLLRDAGATVTRVPVAWAEIERTRGTYDWRALDGIVDFLQKQGLQIVGQVGTTPDWAMDQSPAIAELFRKQGVEPLLRWRAPSPSTLRDLGRFALALQQRYKGRIVLWEFWREPDGDGMPVVALDENGRPASIQLGGDPRAYAEMLRTFAINVRKAEPAAAICVGGLVNRRPDFLEALYANGAGPHFTAVGLAYRGKEEPLSAEWLDAVQAVMTRSGDANKRIWITEWGWHVAGPGGAAGGVSEAHQARLVREALALMKTKASIGLACYQGLNDVPQPSGLALAGSRTGLVRADLSPRPALQAFWRTASNTPDTVSGGNYVNLLGGLPSADEGGVSATVATVSVDAVRTGAAMLPMWEAVSQPPDPLGADLIAQSAEGLKSVGAKLVRFDPLPDPAMVAALPQEPQGGGASSPRFDSSRISWSYLDAMRAAIEAAGAQPMLVFGTMPSALSSPVGNPRMPRDLAEWGAMVEAIVRHCNVAAARGAGYWELGDRPDTGKYDISEYLRMYTAFAQAVIRADSYVRVGGPGVDAGAADWIEPFVEHCAENRLPLSFVSVHAAGLSMDDLARRIASIRSLLARHAAFKETEIVVSSWRLYADLDPRNDSMDGAIGLLEAQIAAGELGPVRLVHAALRDGRDLRRPGDRYTGRWGLLAADGTTKPAFASLQLLRQCDGSRVRAESDETDLRTLATRTNRRISVALWRRPAAETAGETDRVPLDTPARVQIQGLPWKGPSRGTLWRLVENQDLGSSGGPRATFERVARFDVAGGPCDVPVVVPPRSVLLLQVEPRESTSVELTAATSRYVIFGGSAFECIVTVRNRGAQEIKTGPPVLTWSGAKVTRAAVNPNGPVRIGPGQASRFSYIFTAPVSNSGSEEFAQVTLGSAATALGVKFVAPVSVRSSMARVSLEAPGAPPDSAAAVGSTRVTVENHANATLPIELQYGQTKQTFTLPGRMSLTREVRMAAPRSDPGNYRAPIDVLVSGRLVAREMVQIAVPALCRRAPSAMRMNGDLTEWQNAFNVALDSSDLISEKRWSGRSDLSANLLTMWDERNLYIALSVADNVHNQPYTPDAMVRGDSVQIALDASWEAPGGRERLEAIHEFAMALLRTGPALYRLKGAAAAPAPVPGASIQVLRAGNLTIYEAAIPWSELGIARPAAGRAIGLSLRINDNDETSRGQLQWPRAAAAPSGAREYVGLRLTE